MDGVAKLEWLGLTDRPESVESEAAMKKKGGEEKGGMELIAGKQS